MKVLEHYPAFFSREEGIQIGNHISLEELKNVLSSFERDKISDLDSWTAELFIIVFSHHGQELLEVVELTRRDGFMSGSLNSTFIALIPKNDSPKLFQILDELCYAIWFIKW